MTRPSVAIGNCLHVLHRFFSILAFIMLFVLLFSLSLFLPIPPPFSLSLFCLPICFSSWLCVQYFVERVCKHYIWFTSCFTLQTGNMIQNLMCFSGVRVHCMGNIHHKFIDDKTHVWNVFILHDASPLPPSSICFGKNMCLGHALNMMWCIAAFFLVTLDAERVLWEVIHESHQVWSGV